MNRKLLPLKMNFFFTAACAGPIVGFLPTIAKQLGYSLTTYGVTMTFMSVFATLLAPAVCIAVDRFRVRKHLFVTAVLGIGVMSFSFLFVPGAPLDAVAWLECDGRPTSGPTTLYVHADNNDLSSSSPQTTDDNGTTTTSFSTGTAEPITCELNCMATKPDGRHNNIIRSKKSHVCDGNDDDGMTTLDETGGILNGYDGIEITFGLRDKKQVSGAFPVISTRTDDNGTTSTICRCGWQTFCRIVSCTDTAVTDAAKSKSFRGNVLGLYQFWIFFAVVTATWSSLVITTALQNPICLDILGDRTEDFGKQKCWTSFGWGSFSIFIGWLVDVFSAGKKDKDYSPVFFSCMVLTVCNLIVTYKIQVVETKKVKGKWKSVYGLFAKPSVIAFYIWTALNTFFHTIITHFLFWYMEDLVSANNDQNQRAWIKTLQGLTQGIQCFGGEIPFFFWSGWIIKTVGHYNCMAIVLGAMALRMYLYTVISNPAWIILIELLNGVSFALGYSVTMSYAKIIAPLNSLSTVIGLIGLVNCFGESLASLLGGYLFDSYGGVWSFRFFAYSSGLVCGLNILSNFYGLIRRIENFRN